MNRLSLSLLVLLFGFALPSVASADEPITAGGPVGAAPYCGPDGECPPPTRVCDIGTEENPVPAQENCIWPEDACVTNWTKDAPVPEECFWPDDPTWEYPDYCAGYPGWEDDQDWKDGWGDEGSEPGYPGDDYVEETGVDYPDDSDWTDPGDGVEDGDWTNPGDGVEDGDWTDPGDDGVYCALETTIGGPKTWKNPRQAKAQRLKAKRRAAKQRSTKAKRSRVQARKAKARKAAARKQARAQAARRG